MRTDLRSVMKRTSLGLCCLVMVATVPVSAQQVTPVARAASPSKSPELAGTLSWLLPGAGSFYAGNVGHGFRHLVAVPLVLGATVMTYRWADTGSGELGSTQAVVLLSGALLLAGNTLWSVKTAVADAKAYNRRALGSLELSIAPSASGIYLGLSLAWSLF
jgi:hypothetical protein